MLPSMPLLMTPVKEINDDSSDSSDDSPPVQNDIGLANSSAGGQTHTTNGKIGLMQNRTQDFNTVSSSLADKGIDKHFTHEKRSSSEPSSAQKKKKTQHKKYLAALTPDNDVHLEISAQNFAEAYFQKVKSTLEDKKWSEFVQELTDFEKTADKQPTELYKRMEVLLQPHTDLVDEFLAFLLPHQALQVNRLMPYLVLVSMKEFLRKMNILLMKKHVRQVYSALESLTNKENVTLVEVKDAILPLLKSSPLLTNHFLAMLPGERPPESLMTDFEQLDFKDDSLFETIVIPDCPDPYGNENCVCSCHATQKTKHCISCGIKYLNGRVYLQHGKSLRPAKVTFKGNKHLDLQKWEEENYRSRRRFPPKTMLSPNCSDHRLNADSEDDSGVKKSPRTPRLRVSKPKVCKKEKLKNKEQGLDGIFPLTETTNLIKGGSTGTLDVEVKPEGQEEQEFNDLLLKKQDQNEDQEFDDMVLEKHDDVEDQEFDDMVLEKHDDVEDQEFDDMVLDKNDDNEDQEFDDMVLENECNTEEDEEEDLNRLHSENESSLDAEDMTKELESGNDCSFEDEEVDDNEHSYISVLPNKMSNTGSEKIHKEDKILKCSIVDLKSRESNKTICIKTEGSSECKIQNSTIEFEQNTGKEPKSSLEPEIKNIAITSDNIINGIAIEVVTQSKLSETNSHNTVDNCKVKTEPSSEDKTDISCVKIEGSSSIKFDCTSPATNDKLANSRTTSGSDTEHVVDAPIKEWTREEDKTILQTFQHESGLEQTFETASIQLPNRSKEEIQERFEVLLKLLKEMISDKSNSNT